MFAIESNLEEVIADFARLEQQVKTGHAAVMQAQPYVPRLKESALRVLDAMTTDAEKPVIPVIMGTFAWLSEKNRMEFTLKVRTGSEGGLVKGDLRPGDLRPLDEAIRKWVAEQKEKTSEKDYQGGRWLDNEAIAQRVIQTIAADPAAWFNSTNASGLLAYLKQYAPAAFAEATGLTGLNEARVSELLDAVLNFWSADLGVEIERAMIDAVDAALRVK